MQDALSRRPRAMTVAEFLDWPGDGSPTHGTIQSTLNALIFNALATAGSPCRVVCDPGVITARHSINNMRVPDLGITCTPDAAGQRALPNPVVLIEILSLSNATDTWDNVWAYTTVPSVCEIVVVHSMRIKAELLRRGADGSWPAQTEEIGPDRTLRIESVDFACPLRVVYAQTHLA